MKLADRLLFSLVKLPIPQVGWRFLERLSILAQGKGWGAESIKEEVSACCSLLENSPALLIDIGGNEGLYSSEFLKHFPDSLVYIFEPSTLNIKRLKSSFAMKDNVNIVPIALSDTSDSLPLFADEPGSPLGTLSADVVKRFLGTGISMEIIEKVTVTRFDEYWSGSLLKKHAIIDYVKIDVEGNEMSVLKGFGKLISNIKLIQFEFGSADIDTRSFFLDFWYFFKNNNFSLFRITPLGPLPLKRYRDLDETFIATNYIALNNAFIPKES